MAKINFAPEAINDLKEIKSYITDDLCSDKAALNIINKIMMRIRQLEDFLKIGAHLSSVVRIETPYRFLVCGKYIAFYKIDDEIHIIRVLYGRRNYIQTLFDSSCD